MFRRFGSGNVGGGGGQSCWAYCFEATAFGHFVMGGGGFTSESYVELAFLGVRRGFMLGCLAKLDCLPLQP